MTARGWRAGPSGAPIGERRPFPAASLALLAAIALGGCSDDFARIGSAPWGAYEVAVEIRPSPPRTGRDEVVVILSGEHHRPVYDALVSVRARADQEWVQAIEDGHVGVYRRAVDFGNRPAATLEVLLQRGGEQTVVSFPVALIR